MKEKNTNEANLEDVKKMMDLHIEDIIKQVNKITPIYKLAFVTMKNEKVPFADFYGNSFTFDSNASEDEIIRICNEENKELENMLNDLEKYIKSKYGKEGIIKSDLQLTIFPAQFGGIMHEEQSKRRNTLACETEKDALKRFRYFYKEAKSGIINKDPKINKENYKKLTEIMFE